MAVSRKTKSETQLALCNKKLQQDLKACKLQYANLRKHSAKIAKLVLLQQEEDKKEISRRLHDEIAQILTGVNFQLSILSRTTLDCSQGLRAKIIEAQLLVEKAVEQINHFARELHPMILDDLGLVVALESYIKEFMKQTKIQVTLTSLIHFSELSDINKTVLFRVAQESLTNIAKHSKATKVTITIRKIKNNVQMVVSDNGVSFKVKNLPSLGNNKKIGLIGMKERMKMVDGSFAITSSPSKGTQVKVQIPLIKG